MNGRAFLALIHHRVNECVCVRTTTGCVRASGSQLVWETFPTKVWVWLLWARIDLLTCHEQAWDTVRTQAGAGACSTTGAAVSHRSG